MSRWTFLTNNIWFSSIPCRLPRASIPLRNHSKLVPKVYQFILPSTISSNHLFYRCTALPNNLDGQGVCRCQEHTQRLQQIIDSKLLWDEYGINDDITVRLSRCISPLFFNQAHQDIAIHNSLSSSGHPWNAVCWSPASANQGNVQGPPGPMDLQLSPPNSWRDTCQCNIGWYRSPVSHHEVLYAR